MAENNVAINRAPYFDGSNFSYWKMRMETYVKANDYDSWQVISIGDNVITLNGNTTLSDTDKKTIEKNNKAKNLLLTTIARSEFYLISSCETAKEIWDILCETYEGTNTIKETKMNALIQQYELFKFKTDEEVQDAFNRFTAITNELASLGKKIPDPDLVRKILRILPPSWDAKKTAIEEAQDLNKLSLSQLREKLMAYESHIKTTQGTESSTKGIAFKAKEIMQNQTETDVSDDEEEEDINLLARRLNRLFKKQRGKKFSVFKKSTEYKKNDAGKAYKEKEKRKEKKEIQCYECKKPGHIKYECPTLIKKIENFKKKSRAMLATWSDLEDTETNSEVSEGEEDEANLCLMATSEVHSESDEDITDTDMLAEMRKLLKALKKADTKLIKYENEIKALKNEKEALKQTNSLLADENDILKQDNESMHVNLDKLRKDNHELKVETNNMKVRIDDLSNTLKSTFKKFDESDKKLSMLISSQRTSNEKHGLGYEHGSSSKANQSTIFVKAKQVMNAESVVKKHVSNKIRNARTYYRSYPDRRYPYNGYYRSNPRRYNRSYTNQNFKKQVNDRYRSDIPYACFFCNKLGHIEKYCYYKRNKLNSQQVNQRNQMSLSFKGPKLVWVPKRT